MSFEIRNMLGLRDGKRVYVIDSNHVSQEEYEYCQVLYGVLWGNKGLVDSLGPTWNMVMDPRFEVIENAFVVERMAVFGGDARLGKQYVDGNSIMSHSMAELETYAEILGEGRYFAEVLKKEGQKPELFHLAPASVMWKYIRQECPNYFDNVKGEPNSRAQRLLALFKADLLGLIVDYAELPLLQEWVKLESGETATDEDITNSFNEPVVFAEIDVLERALTMRSSLRVTAVKILEKTGFLDIMDKNYKLTEYEVDQVLKLIYLLPYDKLYMAAAEALKYVAKVTTVPFEQRVIAEQTIFSEASQEVVEKIKSGELKPTKLNEQEEVERDLTPEEKQIMAMRKEPNRLELFMMLVEAEKNGDDETVKLITPILENNDTEVADYVVASVKNTSRIDRTASAARSVLGMN